MSGMSEQEYTAKIPSCCLLGTLEEHMDILLCWSITNKKPVGDAYCSRCDLNKNNQDLNLQDLNLEVNL